MEKILTISVAAYNAEKDIEKCLESMLQTDIANDLEIIVVNDGSKDNTSEVVRKYTEKYPDIVQLVDKENGGHGSTINTSIRRATGKYFKIVDSDDWVEKAGIEDLVRNLKVADVDLVLNPYYVVDATTGLKCELVKPYCDEQILGTVQSVDQSAGISIAMHALTFRTDVIKKMGPVISEKCFYVDMEYTIFAVAHVERYICFDLPVYCYLLGTQTQSMNIQNLIKRRDQHLHVTQKVIEFYEKNKENMNPEIRSVVLLRIRYAASGQYKIYFNMEPRESKREIVEFDKWLKSTAADVYPIAVDRFSAVIHFSRLAHFSFYGIIVKSLKVLRLVPRV